MDRLRTQPTALNALWQALLFGATFSFPALFRASTIGPTVFDSKYSGPTQCLCGRVSYVRILQFQDIEEALKFAVIDDVD